MTTIVGNLFTVQAGAVRHCRTCKLDLVITPAPITAEKSVIGSRIDKAVKLEMARKGWRLGNCPKCAKKGGIK